MSKNPYNIPDDLPNSASALIRLAIKDLEECESSQTYVVDMSEWYRPDDNSRVCYVCLAGAVMAKSLHLPLDREVVPDKFYSQGIRDKLVFLDTCRRSLRWGPQEITGTLASRWSNYAEAICSLDVKLLGEYEDNPGQFKKEMLHLADLMDKYDVEYINR